MTPRDTREEGEPCPVNPPQNSAGGGCSELPSRHVRPGEARTRHHASVAGTCVVQACTAPPFTHTATRESTNIQQVARREEYAVTAQAMSGAGERGCLVQECRHLLLQRCMPRASFARQQRGKRVVRALGG